MNFTPTTPTTPNRTTTTPNTTPSSIEYNQSNQHQLNNQNYTDPNVEQFNRLTYNSPGSPTRQTDHININQEYESPAFRQVTIRWAIEHVKPNGTILNEIETQTVYEFPVTSKSFQRISKTPLQDQPVARNLFTNSSLTERPLENDTRQRENSVAQQLFPDLTDDSLDSDGDVTDSEIENQNNTSYSELSTISETSNTSQLIVDLTDLNLSLTSETDEDGNKTDSEESLNEVECLDSLKKPPFKKDGEGDASI